jgi:hypothetical protein
MSVLIFLTSQRPFAQFIEIGNGTSFGTYPSYYSPWGNYWENCRTQTLYLASDLGAPSPKVFTALAWNFGAIPEGSAYLNNVSINIKETAAVSFNPGSFADMAGATQVFYSSSLIPAVSAGWQVFDISDYTWTGTGNLIIEVIWGDNGYHVNPYFQTYKTDAVTSVRMLNGYSDATTPPEYCGSGTFYDNMRFYWSPLPLTGCIEGYVFNYDGISISGASVAVEGGPVTVSGADGHYFISGVVAGEQTVGCGKTGYNFVSSVLGITPGDTTLHDFTLTQPNMLVYPLNIDETVNPGEFYSTSLNILNNGNGPLGWHASINYLSPPLTPCDYSIALYDTFGDGWNGGSLDVIVNGSVVLDNITLGNGSGPANYSFTVIPGDQVTTLFTPGLYIDEPYYYIYNAQGGQVWYSPPSTTGPPDILAGELVGACAGSNWLTMDSYNGTVTPFGGVANILTHLDAATAVAGEVYSANIIFTSVPDVGTITVPVTMTVLGSEISAPENLAVELIDDIAGKVGITWDWNGDSFQFFIIKRDGVIVGTTSGQIYSDILPGHGTFCFTVQAVYDEGVSSPAGPGCVEWPDPVLIVNPDSLEAWVWTGFQEDVHTTVSNSGQGTLAFSFPEFIALHLLNDPQVIKNQPGFPKGQAPVTGKGDVSADGKGFPVILGAGGPDDFGYIWIDSDEEGGPNFRYTDISTTGTPIYGLSDDNIVGPYNIGFDFSFYGENKSRFWVNSNGVIGFTSSYITLGNTGIPTNSSSYKDFIAWFWDDMVFKTGSSQVFYQSFTDKTIIQFKNYERLDQPGLLIDAEVLLCRNGRIIILYDNIPEALKVNSCTIGIQSLDPVTGLQVAYNTDYLHSDLAILFAVPSDFIIDVQPASGTIVQGGSKQISITYDSQGYGPGEYVEDLVMETNDPDYPDFVIENTMHVYPPAEFEGIVTDNDDDSPLPGVLVTAGPFQTTTGENGAYILYTDQDVYDVIFEKLGYTTETIADTFALQGQVTPLSTGMWDMNYAPGFVHAEVMDEDTWCEITWTLPDGPYEIVMDDGEADDFFIYSQAGSWNAVKFTPSGYPASAIGGQVYVGDGNFPGPFLGAEFGIAIFDDDGPDGFPGTMLDSSGVTVNNYGWVSFDWLNAPIEDGSFYLALYQPAPASSAAPVGVDLDNPTYYRSYSKFLSNDWSLSPFQDFMIRAWIDGPEGDGLAAESQSEWRSVPRIPAGWQKACSTKSGSLPVILSGFERKDATYKGIEEMSNRNVTNYRIGRYSTFDPNGPPEAGELVEFSNTGNLYYDDLDWAVLAQGWYAYGVKAMYTSGLYSSNTVSNIVGHQKDCSLTFNVALSSGLEPVNVEISLKGSDFPYQEYTDVTPSSGSVVFEHIWKGHYDITAFKIGFDTYIIENAYLTADNVFNIILSEKKYAPKNLIVDPVSLIATWDKPLRTALDEGFEGEQFPPAGWQSLTASEGYGWFRSKDASSQGFIIPPWDGYYAVINNDTAGSANNGCCDYLITPPLDLRESEDYALYFDSFYNGSFGQLAFVEYSLDEGITWEVIHQVMPDTGWAKIEVDLSLFSGMTGPSQVWIAFHGDDVGAWASGWAIDNVQVKVPAPPAGYIDFWVFLDEAVDGVTETTDWNYSPLWYGKTYTASVAAHYSSGLSAKDYYTFTCEYLFPPRNLEGSAPDNAAILVWDPPVELWPSSSSENPRSLDDGLPANLLGYNIYRDGIFIQYEDHSGGMEPQTYVDEQLEPGTYRYAVTGVYDLSPYGFAGETAESAEEGPADVVVDYCYDLEFIETWSIGSFENNEWTSDGSNWSVSGQAGKPAPSVEFRWDPILTNYAVALESYPLCAAGLTEGTIWLDFDMAMFVVQPTGEEMLLVQVWNWESKTWATVAEYSNADGNIDWRKEHLDIREQAMDKVFRIRFMATGVNSVNIRSWYIDNIHVYRTCEGPVNLSAEPAPGEGILLVWQFPDYTNIEAGINPEEGLRELAGINIYRSVDGGDYVLITAVTDGDEYFISEDNLIAGSLYCFKVSAVWQSGTDLCESELSNEACVIWTGIGDAPGQDISGINIYPNPAKDKIFITSKDEMKRVTIFNPAGQPVLDRAIQGKSLELSATSLPPGIYPVHVETLTGIFTRMLTIIR